ncbi:cell division protein FtsZ [Myroides sp. LJL119]
MENTDFGGIKFDLPKNQSNVIKVIGVGGGGSNAINHMFKQGIKGVDFIVCNTDSQALENSTVPNKIQLGMNLTEGLGAGANPEVGQQSALESIEDIEKMLDGNTKMVFITAGMGGGTGTGAAPVIAQLSKERDILTVGIVTIPFQFEGKVRQEQALKGVERLRKQVDSLVVINNNKLREVYGNLGFKAGFSKADEVLSTAARGIAEVITHHYTQNIDLKDAKTVLSDSGTAIMGSSTATGETRAKDAIVSALDSPLLNDNKITGAKNVLLLIVSGTNEITLDEIGEINDHIQSEAGHNANIIMGVGEDESLGESISVTIIATGFNIEQQETIATSAEPGKIIHTLDGNDQKVQRDLSPDTTSRALGVASPDQPLPNNGNSEIVDSDKSQMRFFELEGNIENSEDSFQEDSQSLYDSNSEFEAEKNLLEVKGTEVSKSNTISGLDPFFEIITPTSQVDTNGDNEGKGQVSNSSRAGELRDIQVVAPELVDPIMEPISKTIETQSSVTNNPDIIQAPLSQEPISDNSVIIESINSASSSVKKEEAVYFTLEDYTDKELELASAKPVSKDTEDASAGFKLTIQESDPLHTPLSCSELDKQESVTNSKNSIESDEVNPIEMSLEEYSLRSRTAERRKKMKDFNYKFNTNASNSQVDEMESEPAYKRTGVTLQTKEESTDASRISLSVDSNNENKLRSNNSFLHDNVD